YYPLKGLTAEQLFDTLSVATGYRDNTPLQQKIFGFGTARANFMEKFTDQEKKTEYHTSIPQALTMMHNHLSNEATDPDKGRRPRPGGGPHQGRGGDVVVHEHGGEDRDADAGGPVAQADEGGGEEVPRLRPEAGGQEREEGPVRRVLGAAEQHRVQVQPLTAR